MGVGWVGGWVYLALFVGLLHGGVDLKQNSTQGVAGWVGGWVGGWVVYLALPISFLHRGVDLIQSGTQRVAAQRRGAGTGEEEVGAVRVGGWVGGWKTYTSIMHLSIQPPTQPPTYLPVGREELLANLGNLVADDPSHPPRGSGTEHVVVEGGLAHVVLDDKGLEWWVGGWMGGSIGW